MRTKRTDFLLTETVNPVNENDQYKVKQDHQPDIQVRPVKQRRCRRKFNKADKLKILEGFDACNTPAERGAFLRKEGLYYASIVKWRLQLNDKALSHSNSKAYKMTLAHNQVLRENAALKKKLAQAEAIIDLQKKVSELLSQHVLTPETSEVSS
jgi:transposase